MNNRDREKLLAETFAGEWSEGPVSDFARVAAAHARRRRGIRRAVIAGGSVAGIVAALILSLQRTTTPLASPAPTTAAAKPAYEIISDDELLAQLKDRPLLMVEIPNGGREIVVLKN